MSEEEENPLQTDADLDELMRRDPLNLTDDEVDKIASRLRQQRHNFLQEELKKSKSGGKKSGGAKPKQQSDGRDANDMSLDDLNLNLNL